MKSNVVRDMLILVGAGSLVYGAWMAWHPMGVMLGGAALAGFGVLWELDGQRRREIDERNRRQGL